MWLTIGTIAIAVVGVYAGLQAWQASRTDHTVTLHRDFSTGDLAGARSRLSGYFFEVGERETGVDSVCYQPFFGELLPPRPAVVERHRWHHRPAGPDEGHWRYPPGSAAAAGSHSPLEDFYAIARFFERVSASYSRGRLDAKLLDELMGHDILWWNAFCFNIRPEESVHRAALSRLAAARPWKAEGGPPHATVFRCGPQAPADRVGTIAALHAPFRDLPACGRCVPGDCVRNGTRAQAG